MSRRLVVFVHIPKTAGTSLTQLLRLNDPVGTKHIGNVFRAGGGVVSPIPYERMLRGLEEDRSVRVIHGHVPVSVDKHLPPDWDLQYITFLREPVERALSHYYQQIEMTESLKRDGRTGAEAESVGGLPRLTGDEPPEEVFSEVRYVPDNLHVRMLSGYPDPFGKVTEDMFERAKDNLATHFSVFGLAERFDESLVLLKRRLGFESILYEELRVAQRPRAADVPAEVIQAAEAANVYDRELYRYAERLFERFRERRDPEFALDVTALRRAKDETAKIGLPPRGFAGDATAWKMVVEGRALLFRRERDVRGQLLAVLDRTDADDRESSRLRAELEVASSSLERLETQVARLQAKLTSLRTSEAIRRVGRGKGEAPNDAPATPAAPKTKAGRGEKAKPAPEKAAKPAASTAALRTRSAELDRRSASASARFEELQARIAELAAARNVLGGRGEEGEATSDELKRLRRQVRTLKARLADIDRQRQAIERELGSRTEDQVVAS